MLLTEIIFIGIVNIRNWDDKKKVFLKNIQHHIWMMISNLTKICCKFFIRVLIFLDNLYYYRHTKKGQSWKYLVSEQILNLVCIPNKCIHIKINHNNLYCNNQGLIEREQGFVASSACTIHTEAFLVLPRNLYFIPLW